MINRKYNNWQYTADMEMMAFFASIIDEMTFNYTIDSFKAPALNTISMIDEALLTLHNVDAGETKEGALGSVYEELIDMFEHDKVFREVLEHLNLDYLIDNLNLKSIPQSEIISILEILSSNSSLSSDYLNAIIRKLCIHIKNNTNKKEEVEVLCRLFITQLRNLGYSDNYIYHTNKDFFDNPSNVITSVNVIYLYFQNFTTVDRTYEVYFNCQDLLAQKIQATCYKIVDKAHIVGDVNKVGKFCKYLKGKNYALCMSVDSKDFYSAKTIAIERLKSHLSLLNLYHHKYPLFVSNYSLVTCIDSGHSLFIKSITPPIQKCNDLRVNQALNVFNKKIANINTASGYYGRLLNALRLHDSALNEEILDNQYMNLFTALEVLIPKDENSDKSRILQIYDTLIPYLCVNYYRKLVDSVLLNLTQWDKAFTIALLDRVKEGTNYTEKLVALVTLNKYDGDDATDPAKSTVKELNELYNRLYSDKYFLMLYRLNRLYRIFKSKKEILEFIERHEQRLKWHIDRIYRVRNGIVHAGTSSRYISTLIENIHSYIDILLKQLVDDNIAYNYGSINYSFIACSYRYKKYKNFININRQKKSPDTTIDLGDELLNYVFVK